MDDLSWAPAEPVLARPGDEGIVLRLRRACPLLVHVEGDLRGSATLRVADAEGVTVLPARDSSTQVGALNPGIYAVSAVVDDRIGYALGVGLDPPPAFRELTLELSRGATLDLWNPSGQDAATYRLYVSASLLVHGTVAPLERVTEVVPAGRVTVAWVEGPGFESDPVHLDVAPGDRVELRSP